MVSWSWGAECVDDSRPWDDDAHLARQGENKSGGAVVMSAVGGAVLVSRVLDHETLHQNRGNGAGEGAHNEGQEAVGERVQRSRKASIHVRRAAGCP